MKKYIIFLLAAFSIAFISCDDCPLEKNDDPSLDCQVREATITKFNPSLEERTAQAADGTDSTYYSPVPEYSIHALEFPMSQASSGSLPNDERFEDKEEIIVASVPFADKSPYFAAILDTYPLNNILIGDIIVKNVDDDLTSAKIRVAGKINSINDLFLSENADDFCDFIDGVSSDELDDLRDGASKYGKDLPSSSQGTYDANDVVVVDENLNIVTDNPPAIAQEDINSVLNIARDAAYDINVSPGDVFYYEATNGRDLIFVVVDISEGRFEPNKKRVTIMFNLID